MFNVDADELQKQESIHGSLLEKVRELQCKGIFPFHAYTANGGMPIIDVTDIVFPVGTCIVIELQTTPSVNEPIHINFKDAT